jgi:hypothetical protein
MTPVIALDQPGIRRLLSELLERLERNPSRDRVPMQKLDAAHMPEFGPRRSAGEGDAAWKALQSLEAAGFIAIDPVKVSLDQAPFERAPRVRLMVEREEELRAIAGIPRRGPGPQKLWRSALGRAFGAGDPRVERLCAFRMPFVEGRSVDDIANGLLGLAGRPEPIGTPIRSVSARYFWGDSKFLDERGDLIAALLGEPSCPYPEMRVHLGIQIASDDFRDVLLIENQDTFDVVCKVARSLAPAPVVLCAHGFKASARRVRTRLGCLPLYVLRSPATMAGLARFETWLFREGDDVELPVWFWGDLDWEGLKILKGMREAFSTARAWKPGYEPMVQLLRSGGGHEPDQAGKGGQRQVDFIGCEYADGVLRQILLEARRFIDQEVVLEHELIRHLGR